MRSDFKMSDFVVDWLSPVITVCLLLVVCLLWCYRRDKELPPGSLGFPVIGETIALAVEKVDFFRKRRRRYGDVFKTHIFLRPTVRVSGAENVQVILKGDKKIVTTDHPKSVLAVFGSGALSQMNGQKHRIRKRNFMQALTGESLEKYIPNLASIIEDSLSDWTRPGSVDLCQEMKALSLHATLSILYGDAICTGDMQSLGRTADAAVKNLLSVPINLPGTSFNKALNARRQMEKFVRKFVDKYASKGGMIVETPMVTQLRKELHNKKSAEVDPELLSLLSDSSLELIIAGGSSMLSTLTNSVLLLARYPVVLSRIRAELGLHSLDNPKTAPLSDLSLAQLQALTYLDQVISEVLRLYPPIGGGYRTVTRPFHVGGYYIPKGWAVAFSIRETHDNADIPRCSEFDPDRWEEDNVDRPDRKRFTYIPFGAGARSCPGRVFAKMVIKMILVELCRSSQWSVLGSYKMEHYPIPIPNKPVRVKFTPQNQSCR